MIPRQILNVYSHRIKSLQKLLSRTQTVQSGNQETIPENKSKRTKISKPTASTEISKQLRGSSIEYFLDHIPKIIFRRSSSPDCRTYLVNEETAKTLASIISNDLGEKKASYVIECSPGLGLLTQELLNNGIPSINLYEKSSEFLDAKSPLSILLRNYKDRLNLRQLNFDDVWMTMLRDNFYHDNNSEAYFIDVPKKKWKDEPFAQIITFCPSRRVLSLFIHNFVKQTRIFENGRPKLYLVISSLIWNRIYADHNDEKNMRYYSQYNVFLHLFFNFKCLGEVPRTSLAPWPNLKANKKDDPVDIPLFLIKIEPKSTSFDIVTEEDIKGFWFFLKHCMRSQKHKVISEFEKFVPGCGPKVIGLDMDICTTFKGLSPKKLLEIFNDFRSWPEYDETLFTPSERVIDVAKKDDEQLDPEEVDNIDQVEQNKLASEKIDPPKEDGR